NVAQWSKTSKCWENIKCMTVSIAVDSGLLIDKEDIKYIKKDDKYKKKIDSGIEIQMKVYGINLNRWKKLYEYYNKYEADHNLSSLQIDILQKMAKGMIKIPSEKQSAILYKLFEQARDEGVNL
ncbi:MAG: hypothetical protein WA440_07630, partial [Ignavibacteriaceae bacterium]